MTNIFKNLMRNGRNKEDGRYIDEYDADFFLRSQKEIFEKTGLDYDGACGKLALVLEAKPHLRDPSASQHHHLFAALSLKAGISRILEIGTYDGKAAALLSHLFPDARIETVDLPDDHPVFASTYNRENDEARAAFIRTRDELLASCPNVVYSAKDSIAFTLERESRYDLIWVDGAHGYPVVAIDLANAVRLLAPDGLIACDDVWTELDQSDAIYRSLASYQTLQCLQDAGLISFELIYKRLTAKSNANPKRRKYIGVLKKTV